MGKSAVVSVVMLSLLKTLEGQSELREKVCEYFIKNEPSHDSETGQIMLKLLRQSSLSEADHAFLMSNRVWATHVINHLDGVARSGHFYERIHGGQAPDGAGGRTKGAGDGWNR